MSVRSEAMNLIGAARSCLLTYRRRRSFAQIVRDSKRGLIAVTKTGSHCPFLDGRWFPFIKDPLTGKWMLKSWADEASVEFYVAALQVYDERRFM